MGKTLSQQGVYTTPFQKAILKGDPEDSVTDRATGLLYCGCWPGPECGAKRQLALLARGEHGDLAAADHILPDV